MTNISSYTGVVAGGRLEAKNTTAKCSVLFIYFLFGPVQRNILRDSTTGGPEPVFLNF
jgi:hypothetical protein